MVNYSPIIHFINAQFTYLISRISIRLLNDDHLWLRLGYRPNFSDPKSFPNLRASRTAAVQNHVMRNIAVNRHTVLSARFFHSHFRWPPKCRAQFCSHFPFDDC